MAVTINADNGAVSGSAGLKYSSDSTGVLALQTNGTTAVSISTGQVVTLTQPLPVASGGTGATTLTANNVLLGNGTSAPQFVAPGTTGNVLTSDGSTWTSAAAVGGFTSGTVLLFYQASAPTGWTKVTTAGLDDSALRIVTGTGGTTGGSVAFSTAFASQTPAGTVSVAVSAGTLAVGVGTLSTNNTTAGGTNSSGAVSSHTLATSEIPSHTHNARQIGTNIGCGPGQVVGDGACGVIGDFVTKSTGGGGGHSHGFTQPTFTGTAHNHTISGSPSLSGSPSITSATFTGNAINLAVKYANIILCSKN